MTTTLFIILASMFCTISGFLTEGIKTLFKNMNKGYAANLIALINALVVGCGGSAIAYVLLGIAFTLPNILCLLVMAGVVWLGSMIGYDKVMQLVTPITSTK